MADRCPLLLKYKFRNCYCGWECEYDPATDEWDRDWKSYKDPEHIYWRMQRPNSQKFFNLYSHCDQFIMNEICAYGDENPAAILFRHVCGLADFDVETQSYQLSENYKEIWEGHRWAPKPILQDYERNRGEWKPVIAVRFGGMVDPEVIKAYASIYQSI